MNRLLALRGRATRTSKMTSRHALLPFLSVALGIGAFSAMDAAMKAASLAAGVYSALLLRNLMATGLMVPVWLLTGRRGPSTGALAIHLQRSAVVSVMAALFFYGLVRIPIAEAVALSFIAPLIALYLAALMLGEVIKPKAVLASLLGLAGVVVIGAARFGRGDFTGEAVLGIAATLVSAVLYALNLVLQRKQALLADPIEIAMFQNLFVATLFLVLSPFLFEWPPSAAISEIAAAAALAVVALLLLSWGYAREETQALVPIEYTGFLWAALFGWLRFGEEVGAATVAGAGLIVAGCWIAARKPTEQTAV